MAYSVGRPDVHQALHYAQPLAWLNHVGYTRHSYWPSLVRECLPLIHPINVRRNGSAQGGIFTKKEEGAKLWPVVA